MRQIKAPILKREAIKRVCLAKMKVLRILSGSGKAALRVFQLFGMNVKAPYFGLWVLLRHLARPDACSAGNIQNLARRAQRHAGIAALGQLVEEMLKVEPLFFSRV